LYEAAHVVKTSREILEGYANVISRLNNKFIAWEDTLVAAEAAHLQQRTIVH
jgi:hypothetical protein